jgi:hypothetical protein
MGLGNLYDVADNKMTDFDYRSRFIKRSIILFFQYILK